MLTWFKPLLQARPQTRRAEPDYRVEDVGELLGQVVRLGAEIPGVAEAGSQALVYALRLECQGVWQYELLLHQGRHDVWIVPINHPAIVHAWPAEPCAM